MAQDGVIPIRVLVRVRPLSRKEKNENAQECVRSYVEQNQISCNDKMFAFDAVFDPACSQDDVYLASAGVLVDKLFAGYNCTILAYGQTGSGKTHTMGTEETTETMMSEDRGIVPRIVSRIFEAIGETEIPAAFNVKVSMLEVYDDKVIDLLTRTPNRDGLQIREKDGAPFVQGLSTHDVGSLVTTMAMLERGCSLRSKGETAMNAASSRSHAVFTILVEKCAVPNDESVWESKLRLVDLAGSERLKKTMAEGERKKEGIKINEGLHALGKVIQALSAEEKHIPYRDSKITRLLQDSLGGSSYTVMIACVSPADSNGEETLSTLRYADRVKSIKNKPTVQLDPTQALIQKLRDENAALRLEVAAYRAGEVPDATVSLAASGPPTMMGGGRAQPLALKAAPAAAAAVAATPVKGGSGTPRRVVRREEFEEEHEKVKGLERMIGGLKEKIAELVMYKAKQSEALMAVETEVERLQESVGVMEGAIREALAAETPEACYERMKGVMERVEKEKEEKEKEENEKEKDEDAARDHSLAGDDSKMEDSSTVGGEGEGEEDEEDHQEKLNGIVRNTENLEREMENIMREIAMKEKLVTHNTEEWKRLHAMEGEHKKQMEALTVRLNELQKERDTLNDQLRKMSTSSKLSEERRKRLMEIEKELHTQRRKMNELKNIEKMKKQSDETAQKLKKEISEMKALRVRMTKQMKAETDKYRQYKMIADKKMAQMISKDRKRDTETARLRQNLSQQLVVVKRKYEEATAANKRLQAQLLRSKNASSERKMDEKTEEMWKEHVHNELELVASTYTAERSADEMIKQRKTLSRTLKGLTERLAKFEKPPNKRQTLENGDDGLEAEKERLLGEKRDCEEEIEKINATIQSLQSNSSDVNLASLTDSRWSTVHTVAAAKLALKHLFEEATNLHRQSVDEKKTFENEYMKMEKRVEMLKGDVKKRQATIESMEKLKAEYLKNLSQDKVELEKRRGSLLQMILESDKVVMTDEQMDQLKEMQDSIQGMGAVGARARARRRASRSFQGGEVLMEGPRETRSVTRFGDQRNTLEEVKMEEGEMDCTMNDEQDRTFRIEDKSKGKRRTRSAKGEAEEEEKPKKMTRSNSKKALVEVSSSPQVEAASRRDSMYMGRGGEGTIKEEEEDERIENTTFILPKKGEEEMKENKRGSLNSRVTRKGASKSGSPDDLRHIVEDGIMNETSGGLGDIM